MKHSHGRYYDAAFAIACALALAFWLGMGSGQTFMIDEWGFVMNAHDWSFDQMMQPLNEHWSLGLNLMWKPLMATVGMSSYMPYLLVTNLLHIAGAAGIYVFARRQTAPVIALGAGLVFLFLGSGFIDFVLGMQMNFNLVTAAGVWALVILMREPRPRHAWLAALLLVVAVATNGVGLPFVAAAAAIIVVSRPHWRWWWVPLPAVVAFGAWYLTYGRGGGVALPSAIRLLEYMVNGVGNAFGQVVGLGAEVGLVIAVLVTVAALVNVAAAGRVRLGLTAGVVGVFALFAIIGLARAAPQPPSFAAGRFVDVAAAFCLIAIVGWLGHRRLAHGAEGHRVVLVVVAVVGVSLASNISRAFAQDDHWQLRADSARAAYTLMVEFGGSEAIPADRGFAYHKGWMVRPAVPGEREWLPSPDRFAELVERYGSPQQDPLAPWGVDVPDEVLDDLFAQFMAGQIGIGPGEASGESLPLESGNAQNLTTSAAGQCEILEATGPQPWLDVIVPAGSQLAVMSDTDGAASLAVSLRGTYTGEPLPVELPAGESVYVGVPDIGAGKTMQLRLSPPATGLTLVCLRTGDG